MYLVKFYLSEDANKLNIPLESFILMSESRVNKIFDELKKPDFAKLRVKIPKIGFDMDVANFVEVYLNFFKINDKDSMFVMEHFGVDWGNLNLDAIFTCLMENRTSYISE